jgi:hypothetical protein
MSTAYAVTTLLNPEPMCLGRLYAEYKCQISSSLPASGEALGNALGSDFTYVTQCIANISGAAADGGYLSYFEGGTYSAGNGYPVATIKHTFYQSAGSAAALDEADAVDLKAIDDIIVSVIGKK